MEGGCKPIYGLKHKRNWERDKTNIFLFQSESYTEGKNIKFEFVKSVLQYLEHNW